MRAVRWISLLWVVCSILFARLWFVVFCCGDYDSWLWVGCMGCLWLGIVVDGYWFVVFVVTALECVLLCVCC